MNLIRRAINWIRMTISSWVFYFCGIIATVAGCWFLLEYPTVVVCKFWYYLGLMTRKYALVNMATVGILLCILYMLTNRVWLAQLLCSVICWLIGTINHYVLMFHGMPLSFLTLRNFTTAMNVISAYQIRVDHYALRLLALFAVLVAVALVVRLLTGRKKQASLKRILLRDGVLALVCCLTFSAIYLGDDPIKPKKTFDWSWRESYSKYGYTASMVESLFQLVAGVSKPEGYSEEKVDNLEIPDAAVEEPATPDVILILNETFYDLRQLVDVKTDVPFLDNIESMDNLLTGYAVSPQAGGGTNCSEYEILSSNSMQLLPGVTPFNVLDLANASSIVSSLNSLGYSSLGAHSEISINYSRGQGYKNLQFQSTHFREDFQGQTYFGGRTFATDESLYENLIRWYEEAPEENPRFLYLLTIQNHGDHKKSDDENDLVHVQNDFGAYNSEINEFLTLIHLSDQAFRDLTEYFSQVDRPVIVCMLGDHSPSFASALVENGPENNLLLRKVPLLIWANFPLEQRDLGTMSMNYVVPTLFDIAGIQLTPYYSYLLRMKEDIPILTSYGDYYDAEGNRYTYDSDQGGPYEELVDSYFYLEYENITKGRNQELFVPYP